MHRERVQNCAVEGFCFGWVFCSRRGKIVERERDSLGLSYRGPRASRDQQHQDEGGKTTHVRRENATGNLPVAVDQEASVVPVSTVRVTAVGGDSYAIPRTPFRKPTRYFQARASTARVLGRPI